MKKLLLLLSIFVILLIGCNDEDDTYGRFVVRLTDSPADYEEVLIDLQELLVNVADDDSGWTQLPLEVTGQIDLLKLTNGNDTLLLDEILPTGKISQMRMVLGPNNQLKKAGEYYDLSTPSAQQSGLKFNIHTTLESGVTYEMWIDFEAARSIVEKGNGEYSLKPTIKVFTEATSGSIVGTVIPKGAKALVQAISASNDITSTYSDETSGDFVIRGLEAGTYKVEIVPGDGYHQGEIENVSVSIEAATDIGVILLVPLVN